ncbi:MAG: hypothetical protein ACYCZJ_13345 [Sulfuriferula sp.]
MINTVVAAKKIIFDAKRGDRAVFFINGQFKTLPVDGSKFSKTLLDIPQYFCGIYNEEISIDDLVSDLDYVVLTEFKEAA